MSGRLPLSIVSLVILAALAMTACSGGGEADDTPEEADVDLAALEEGATTGIVVTSTFTEGEPIPGKYSCYGLDLSPPVSWTGAPDGTKSLAVVFVEPEAPGGKNYIHWLLYDLPPDTTEIPEALPSTEAARAGGKHGKNDFRRWGWGGPCPPRGTDHFYFLKVYALDAEIDLEEGATKGEVISAMTGHLIGVGQLMGTYYQRDGQGDW